MNSSRAHSPARVSSLGGRVASALALFLALALVGCADQPPSRVAFRLLEGMKATAIACMESAGDVYRAGAMSEADRAKAEAAYTVFRAACNTAAIASATITTADQIAVVIAAPQQKLSELQAVTPPPKVK